MEWPVHGPPVPDAFPPTLGGSALHVYAENLRNYGSFIVQFQWDFSCATLVWVMV